MNFVQLIKYKLLIIANPFLLNMAQHENFSANKYDNANYCWHFHIYWQTKFHAQFSWVWKSFLTSKPGCITTFWKIISDFTTRSTFMKAVALNLVFIAIITFSLTSNWTIQENTKNSHFTAEIMDFLDVTTTSHDVASTLMRRFINAICPQR